MQWDAHACFICKKKWFNSDIRTPKTGSYRHLPPTCESCRKEHVYNDTNIHLFSRKNAMDPGDISDIPEPYQTYFRDATLIEKALVQRIAPVFKVCYVYIHIFYILYFKLFFISL